MAFTFHDHETGEAVYDLACGTVVGRDAAGATVVLIKGGKVQAGVLPAVPAPYTDAKAQSAIKGKTQINALTAASTAADIVAALKA